MGILFLLADPDFIPYCDDQRTHILVEMEPNEHLCRKGCLAFNCPICGRVRYFDDRTAADITEEII